MNELSDTFFALVVVAIRHGDHCCNDEATKEEDSLCTTKYGQKRRKMMTRGWEICVEWKDGSQTWIALKDLKRSYPIQLADYAVRNHINHLSNLSESESL